MGRDQRFAEMRRGRQMQSQQDLARMMASAGVGGGQPVVPAEPTDRFGVPIRVGDLVLYHANIDPVFEVTDVSPIVHPAAPRRVRAVTHLDVDRAAVERAAEILCELLPSRS